MSWTRYAVYWAPEGHLGELGASWLGWDIHNARRTATPEIEAPKARRYGFHATLKPPFTLAEGRREAELSQALAGIAASAEPQSLGRLELRQMGKIWVMAPSDTSGISEIAGRLVRELDAFRAPPDEVELARRRGRGLTAVQEENLKTWGYPYVLSEFHPHLTLSDARVPEDVEARARSFFAPVLDRPMVMQDVTLMGEDALGRFHAIESFTLSRARMSKAC